MGIDTIDFITIIISVVSMGFSIFTFMKTHIYEKKKLTIDAYIELQESLYFIYEYKKDEIEDFVDDRDSEEYKVLGSCLARIEMYAVGIKNKIYDYKVFYPMAHGFVDGALRSRIEYLIDLKKEYKGKTFYVNTRELLSRMDETSGKER